MTDVFAAFHPVRYRRYGRIRRASRTVRVLISFELFVYPHNCSVL